MAMFGKLNTTYLHNEEGGKFNRGSFYFRPGPWSVNEMVAVMKDIAERSVLYYFSKYREDHFRQTQVAEGRHAVKAALEQAGISHWRVPLPPLGPIEAPIAVRGMGMGNSHPRRSPGSGSGNLATSGPHAMALRSPGNYSP